MEKALRVERSIRRLEKTPVKSEDVERMMGEGTLAPSASNKQHWGLVTIENNEMKKRLCIPKEKYKHILKEKSMWQQQGITFIIKRDYVIRLLGTTKNKRILDFGCGVGTLLKDISKDKTATCHGIDIEPFAIELAQKNDDSKNAKFFVGSEHKNSLPNDFYDAVISMENMEHIENDNVLVRLFRRKLRGNGSVIVTVPSDRKMRDFPGHYRVYTKNSLRELFEKNGFRTICISYYGFPVLKASLTIYKSLFRRGREFDTIYGLKNPRTQNLYNKLLPLFKQLLKIDRCFAAMGFGTGLIGTFEKI